MATSITSAVTFTRQLAQTDSNGISDALGLAFYNDARNRMTRDLVERGIDAAQTQEAYRDLDSTLSPNTYLFPSDMFALKTIEVNWTDQSQDNYIKAEGMDVSNIQERSFSWLRANQPQSHPIFDNRGDQFEIFPTPTVSNTDGIRIFYFLTPTDAADVGTAITYPQLLDYRTLSYLMASIYYKTQGNLNMSTIYEQEYEARMNKNKKILSPASQQPITPQSLKMTGWQY